MKKTFLFVAFMGIDATNFTFPMDRMLAHLFPWLGILSGPIASILYVKQWRPESWMETTLHVVNTVSMVQTLQLLVQDPHFRWALFAIATVQLIAWFMAWGWSTIQDTRYDSATTALFDSDGRDRLRYLHLTMSVGLLAILGTVLLSWSHALQTLPSGALLYLFVLLAISGLLYAMFEVDVGRSTLEDVLAVLNVGIALYITCTFFAGYRAPIEPHDLWRPVLRWFHEVRPLSPLIWTIIFLSIGVVFGLIFVGLAIGLYAQYYKENKPSPRRMRVAAGSFGTMALFILFMTISFIAHMGGWQEVRELTYDKVLLDEVADAKGRPVPSPEQ